MVKLVLGLIFVILVISSNVVNAADYNANGATAIPTFNSIWLYWSPASGSSTKEVSVQFRKLGDA